MKRSNFESMSSDELWMLHEEIAAELAAKIRAEKRAIENRLSLLVEQNVRKSERRPYPIAEIQKSGRAVANVGRSREAATLANSAT
jgi:hypothetical protein